VKVVSRFSAARELEALPALLFFGFSRAAVPRPPARSARKGAEETRAGAAR
jgi:hypothetical protein